MLKASGICCAGAHRDRYALFVLLFAVAILSSCAGLKKSPTKTDPPKDGEKVGVVSEIDSATAALDSTARDIKETVDDINETVEGAISDVGDFFGGLLGTRKDSVMLVPPEPKKSPAVSDEPPGSEGFLETPIKREVEFDSLGNVTVSDEFLGADADIALTQSTDEYLAQRLEQGASEGLRDAAVSRTATLSTPGDGTTPGETDAKTEGGGLLSEYGSVSIPIPPSIVPTIFGKPSINLRVNGDVAVHLAYRDNKFLATTGAFFSGSETGLDFRQEVNMSISGSVGDKIKLSTDFGSLRQFSFENLFKLQYQGYPDEIIQSIEAGNISLNTPSKYVGIQSALFGFKAVNRFGPLYLTAVAAQKKGERQNKNFGGGPGSSTGNEYNIQPANYRRNTFFLDTSFIPRYEQYYAQEPPDDSYPDLIQRGTVKVWKTVQQQNIKRTTAYTWYSLPPTTPLGTYGAAFRVNGDGKTGQSGFMEVLDTNQFRVDYKTGVLTLYQEPSDVGQLIAVSYIDGSGRQFGEEGLGKDEVVLKLIKAERAFTDTSTPTFKNVLKNSYYVGATNIDANGFAARITYTFPSGQIYDQVRSAQGSLKSISVMGLDRYTNSSPGIRTPDAQIDLFNPSTIILDKRTGTLTFPYLQPFGRRILDFVREQRRINPDFKADTTFYMPEIYSRSADYVKQHVEKNNKININVKYTGGTSSTLNLNAFNIVEGSVRVTAGGRQLQEGVDYKVDINSGTVTLLKPDLANAGAVNVEFDQHDFFTTSTKTLLGLRGDIPILDKGLIGFSLLNYSLRLPTIKTRQGEEPLSNWVLGGDASYKFSVPALTSALNFLPIFNLKDKSEILFKADMALSLPNPNTQSSPMGADSGKSIAYLDDFEGGKNDFPLQMRYGAWVHASQPVADSISDNLFGLSPDEVTRRKSKIFWFNREPADVQIKDIKPNRSTATASQTAQVFDVIYDPHIHTGIYNSVPADGSIGNQDRWAGLMQYNQGLNVQSQNTEAIEFWVNTALPGGNQQGFIMLDIGRVSEDVIPDGKLQTEDQNNNGRYDPGEDIGMDVVTNQKEIDSIAGPSNPADPNNDNYVYVAESQQYDNINGTEGNQNDFGSPYPNTEDLDGNSAVNLDNSYFEYKIPLDRTNNKYIIGQNGDWVQYRIPLSDYSRTVGNPDRSFSSISYYRLWFTDFTDRLHLRFHEINLVGSQWTRRMSATVGGAIDSTFEVTYVNIEDNAGAPTNYTPPPGAERDRLAGQSAVVLGNEQSINLRLKCVPTGERREATRVFQSPNDLFNYRSMAIWVHGDDKMPLAAADDTTNTVWVSIRFGIDALNYYEYRRPLSKGWQNMFIDFRRLSNLKAAKLQGTDLAEEIADPAVPGSMYRVVGTPTITNVPIFTLGVENHTADNCLSTDVWFDELRLLEANDQIDYAMNGSIQAKLAEFGMITANIVNERPDFHRVDERFNLQRSLNFGWGITGEFQMQKIFPAWLERGSVFPLTISHTETITKPKFVFNNDIEIEGAVNKIQERADQGLLSQQEANRLKDSVTLTNQTLTVRNSIGATGVKFNFPGSFFILPAFLNRLTYGFGFGEEFTRSPQFEYNRAWSWTGSVLYDLNTGIPKLQVSPLKAWVPPDFFSIGRYSNYTLNFLPQKLTLAFSTTRGRKSYLDNIAQLQLPLPPADSIDTLLAIRSRVPIINRVFTSNRAMNFSWKLTENGLLSPQIDYSLDVASNLGDLETTVQSDLDSSRFRQRSFSAILDDIFMKDGSLVRLGNDNLAVQRFRLTTNPRLPWLFWIDKFIRPLFSYNVEYRWTDAQTREQNAKTGNWFNTITTGVEINLRELGLDIFGRPEPAAPARGRNREGGQVPTDDPSRLARGEDATPEEAFPPGSPLEARPQGRSRARRIGDAAPPPLPGSTLIDSLKKSFGITETDSSRRAKSPGVGTGGERSDLAATDTLLIPKEPPKKPAPVVEEEPGTTIADIARAVIQKPFFDWNGTRFNFIQNNSSTNRALQGVGSGISNFLAKGIFSPEDDGNGPSRAYQLGLITDPHGRLLIDLVPQFPFVKFGVRHGDRAPSPVGRTVDVTDVFTQKNTFELITSRPLWAGAQLNLSWKTEFTYDQRNTLRIDAAGKIDELNVAKTGDVSRTFLSVPPLFGLSENGIKLVGEKWIQKTNELGFTTNGQRDSMDIELRNKLQVESFMQGFETLPMFASKLREYLPRLNYSFSWAGLEKTFLFSWADRASFRHGYSGNYKRQFRLNPDDSVQLTTLQIVTHGFRPLAALDLGWDKVWGGRMTANLNYDTQTEWGADYASNRITKRLSTTFSINANFQKEGLTVPFLNINLKNTFGMTFLLSQTISSDVFYQFNTILDNLDGTGNGGITKTVIEPRFSYDFSQQLTIEGFYRYERTIPAATGVLIPPTRLIMAGFDIRLKIF